MIGTLVAETEAELEERVHDQLDDVAARTTPPTPGSPSAATRWIIGTPDQARTQIEALAAAGAQRLMFQDFLPRDLDMIALLGKIAAG